MQDLGYELPRTHMPRTPVNKGWNGRPRTGAYYRPRSSAPMELSSARRSSSGSLVVYLEEPHLLL